MNDAGEGGDSPCKHTLADEHAVGSGSNDTQAHDS